MSDKKTLWDILKGSLAGFEGEGSNKRVASFYIITILITGMIACFLYSYIYVIHAKDSSNSTMYVLKSFNMIFNTFIVFLSVLMGLASVEQVINVFKMIRGQKPDEPAPKKEPTPPVTPVVTTTTTTTEIPQQ